MFLERYSFILIGVCTVWLLSSPAVAHAETYHCSTEVQLSSVPWLTLRQGDQVCIHWKPDHYRVKIGMRSRGTAQEPIRITGIPGPGGELPVLDAFEAVTPAQFVNYNDGSGFFNEYTEGLSAFFIFRGYLDPYTYKSGYIIIENLRITGCNEGNFFTNQAGGREKYWSGASGIWALTEHLTVRHCQIDDNGNGFFTQSTGDEPNITRDVLFEYNHVFNNGNAWDEDRIDREHNIYTQAGTAMVFQYNHIGRVRAGTEGSSLKDRSANLVIRYNQIEASARALDLVEAEDSYDIIGKEPGYHETYVYGNTIVDDIDSTPHSTAVVHFGADNEAGPARLGPHHFYGNTVVITGSGAQKEWRVSLFDCGTDNESEQEVNNRISVDLQNNILYWNHAVISDGGEFALMRYFGSASLSGANWINSGWCNGRDGFVGTVQQKGTLIEGDAPGFLSENDGNFHLSGNAAVIDKAVPLPADIATSHSVMSEYKAEADSAPRIRGGIAMDLGAYEYSGAVPLVYRHLSTPGKWNGRQTQSRSAFRIDGRLLRAEPVVPGIIVKAARPHSRVDNPTDCGQIKLPAAVITITR